MMSALGLDFAKRQFRQLEKDGIEVDALKINNLWEQHNLGGFKKDADGRISRVSLGDWYQKHVFACGRVLFSLKTDDGTYP